MGAGEREGFYQIAADKNGNDMKIRDFQRFCRIREFLLGAGHN